MNGNKSRFWTAAGKLCVYLLVATLILGSIGVEANAAAAEKSVRMNVMLVIDGSGSLVISGGATDPNGVRYDAIDLFLALLTNSGNNVGAVVFSEEGDNFLLDAPMSQINGKEDKLALSGKIREAGAWGGTNIGMALNKSVQEAVTMSEANGLPAVVILFSDGRTDVDGEEALQASLDAKEAAIVAAQQANIPIYTICLAANSIADPVEMQEIADRTSGAYAQVERPEDLTNAFEAFYSLIFASAYSEIHQTEYDEAGKLVFEVPIPAYGAEEVNIILNNTELLGKTINTPNGVMTEAEMESATMSGGYYDIIKIVDPDPGKLLVELTGIPLGNVTVNVLYNIGSSVKLTTADGKQSYSSGETVRFSANMYQNDSPILDSRVTDEYIAKLYLTDLSDGSVTERQMIHDGNGTFICDVPVTECTSYEARAELHFCSMFLESNTLALNFDNVPPEAKEPLIEDDVYVLYFFNSNKKFDLSSYFTEPQNEPLTYSVVSSQFVQDTVTLDPQTGALNINTAKSRSGNLVIQAADPQGATAQMTIRLDVTNLTLGVSIAIVAGILIAAAVAAYLLLIATRKPWRGKITVTNLTTNQSRTLIDFRGSLPLKKFGLGKMEIDGKFVTHGNGHLAFQSKKPIYVYRGGILSAAANSVTVDSSSVSIYADQDKRRGIMIKAEATIRAGGRGGMGSMGGMTPRQAPKNAKKAPGAGNPFK